MCSLQGQENENRRLSKRAWSNELPGTLQGFQFVLEQTPKCTQLIKEHLPIALHICVLLRKPCSMVNTKSCGEQGTECPPSNLLISNPGPVAVNLSRKGFCIQKHEAEKHLGPPTKQRGCPAAFGAQRKAPTSQPSCGS
eukprot:scaffold101784_cov20-Tisochrysis_lutea.AAC.2